MRLLQVVVLLLASTLLPLLLSNCYKQEPLPLKHSKSANEAFLTAVMNNDIDRVGKLLDTASIPNINEIEGQSLLKIAFDQFEFEIADILLNNGADPNITVFFEGERMPIMKYAFLKSQVGDPHGFYTILIGKLLDHGADIDQVEFPNGFFMEIHDRRVMSLAEKGDLVFINWITLLQTIFQSKCLKDMKAQGQNLKKCVEWAQAMQKSIDKFRRNQIVATAVGDMRYFMKNFDLCPNNDAKLLPGLCGCDALDIVENQDGAKKCEARF